MLFTEEVSRAITQRYTELGTSFETINFGSSVINSVEPDNLQAVFATQSNKWGIEPFRLLDMEPLLWAWLSYSGRA